MSLKKLIAKVNTLANQNEVQHAVHLLMTTQLENKQDENILDSVIDDVEFGKVIDGSIINMGNMKYVKSHGSRINHDLTTAKITKSDVFKITRDLKENIEIINKPDIVLP